MSRKARAAWLLALVCCACSSGAPPATHPVATPVRDFAVRRETRALIDHFRSTPPNGTAGGLPERHLPTDLWIPAPAAGAAGGAPFPLVLFVHGSSGERGQSTFLLEALAHRGYLVAAADFPLTFSGTPGGPSDWHVEEQVKDLSFLAGVLFAASRDAQDPLHALLDEQRGYAVVGHSTGGAVALLAAEAGAPHDPRVSAAASLSGDACFFAPSFFRTRSLPLLVVAATADQLVPAPSNTLYTWANAAAPKTLAVLRGGTHLFFTDLAIPDDAPGKPAPTTTRDPLAQALAQWGGGTACEPVPVVPAATLSFEAQHRLTSAVVAAFLDDAVRGEPQSLGALQSTDDPGVSIAVER